MFKLDESLECKRIQDFINSYCRESGFKKLILGISGGIDSAVSAALAVRSVGAENVIGIMLPSPSSSPESLQDALSLVKYLGIKHEIRPIDFLVNHYFENVEPDADRLRKGNWMARCRMLSLYDLSAKYHALVVGTSNRTELLVGYFTQFGDGACALEPIGHLYKSEVRLLARHLGIPDVIIDKAPTADLWNGQTDEDEMGITYPILDHILYLLTEENYNYKACTDLPYTAESFELVQRLIQRSEYKRKPAPMPERKR